MMLLPILVILGFVGLGALIIHQGKKIMSKVTDTQAAVQASFAKITTALTGIQGDVTTLKAKIDALQNSPGELSPEDQAALDDIQTSANALADKAAALDDLTPPDATEANPGE